MCNIDPIGYQSYLKMLRRDLEKEEFLFEKLRHFCDYSLVNKKWSSGERENDIFKDDMPIIWFDLIEGFSILDWLRVFENASRVETVTTAAAYIFDAFESRASEYIIHRRAPHESLDDAKIVHSRKPWKFIS